MKKWFELIGLGSLTVGAGAVGIVLLALLAVAISAAPIIAILWAVKYLFF